MKGLPTRNALFSAVLLALGVAACATRPSVDVRTVATGDRVRVWLREPTARENPLVGDGFDRTRSATALSGWMQEACPRIEPGDLWLEDP